MRPNQQGGRMVENANRNGEKTVPLTISFTVTTRDKILDRPLLKRGTWAFREPLQTQTAYPTPQL